MSRLIPIYLNPNRTHKGADVASALFTYHIQAIAI
jgi:hypothetical protein